MGEFLFADAPVWDFMPKLISIQIYINGGGAALNPKWKESCPDWCEEAADWVSSGDNLHVKSFRVKEEQGKTCFDIYQGI